MGVVNVQIVKGQGQIFGGGQGVKHENLLGQDLDRSRGWKYRCLCSVPPLTHSHVCTKNMPGQHISGCSYTKLLDAKC